MEKTLYETLRELVKACDSGEYKDVWELYQFLDEYDGLDLYIAVGQELSRRESTLTESQKEEMRQLGCSFPEDWDSPKEFGK